MEQDEKKLEQKSFTDIYDIPCNEAWLEDEAREGLRAVEITGGGRVRFEHTEPFVCRYRLQPTAGRERRPTEDQIELYESMGWYYVGTMKGYVHVWRCEDPDAPELDTDPVAQAEGYRRLVKKSIWDGAVLLILDLAVLAIILYQLLTGGVYYFVRNTVPGYLIAAALNIVFGSVVSVVEVRGLVRLVRRLRDGIPLKRTEDYWKKRVLIKAFSVILIGLVLWNSGMFGLVSAEPKVAYAKTGAVPVAEAVYPRLSRLEGVPEENVEFFCPKVKHHELAPEMWFVIQYADHEDQAQSRLITDCYHMVSEFLVPDMERKLLKNYREMESVGELIPVEAGTLDRFWWTEYVDRGKIEQHAIAIKGKNIMDIAYWGPEDLREHTELFAETLEDG